MLKKENGFTILELMIATSVFSVILLTGSVLIVQIGKMYYKGVQYSRVQDTTRNIIDDISRNAQLTRYSTAGNTDMDQGAICVGKSKYIFNKKIPRITGGQPTLVKTDYDGSGSCSYPPTVIGQELLADYMRLTKFNVVENGRLVTIEVQILYASGGSDVNNPGSDLYLHDDTKNPPAICKGDVVGSQWCASSYLTTTVFRRLDSTP